VAPSPFAQPTPALPTLATELNPIEVALAQDFVVSWKPDTRASGFTTRLLLEASAGTASHGTIACTVKDSAGSVKVPAALLAKYTSGDQAAIVLTREGQEQPLQLDNADVSVSATATAQAYLRFQ
jgi:hypothetical protein